MDCIQFIHCDSFQVDGWFGYNADGNSTKEVFTTCSWGFVQLSKKKHLAERERKECVTFCWTKSFVTIVVFEKIMVDRRELVLKRHESILREWGLNLYWQWFLIQRAMTRVGENMHQLSRHWCKHAMVKWLIGLDCFHLHYRPAALLIVRLRDTCQQNWCMTKHQWCQLRKLFQHGIYCLEKIVLVETSCWHWQFDNLKENRMTLR